MKTRSPWVINPLGTVTANFIRLLMGTVRRRIAFTGSERHPIDPREQRFVYVIWHEAFLYVTPFRVRAHILASHHTDGELMTRIAKQMKIGVIRGSTTRGGTGALLGLVRKTTDTHVLLTPDGPVGPRRRLKPGAVALASMAGVPIVPVGIANPTAWRVRNWDRMMIPKPWSTAHYVFGSSIQIPPELNRAGIKSQCQVVEKALASVTEAAERWATGGPRPIPASTSRTAA